MALSAQATLTHTNGNFDAGAAAGDNASVADWFDGNNHPEGNWEDTWLNTIHQPSGQSGGTVGFSGNVPTATNFLYQALGTRSAGEGTLHFSISVGAFTDGGAPGPARCMSGSTNKPVRSRARTGSMSMARTA